MPRRRPSRVRALNARPEPTPIPGVPLSTSRALDRLDRPDLTSRRVADELSAWRRITHLPTTVLCREHNDWVAVAGPLARGTLEDALAALNRRQGDSLRRAIAPLDARFEVRTRNDPRFAPSSPWWARRF